MKMKRNTCFFFQDKKIKILQDKLQIIQSAKGKFGNKSTTARQIY